VEALFDCLKFAISLPPLPLRISNPSLLFLLKIFVLIIGHLLKLKNQIFFWHAFRDKVKAYHKFEVQFNDYN
jgi:hypothetical protein